MLTRFLSRPTDPTISPLIPACFMRCTWTTTRTGWTTSPSNSASPLKSTNPICSPDSLAASPDSLDHFAERRRCGRFEPEPDLHRNHGQEWPINLPDWPGSALRSSIERGSADDADYQSLFSQGIYSLDNGIKVWAGTADDPFFIDLGAAFDSLNFRKGIGPVLSASIDGRRYPQLRSRCRGRLQRQLHCAGSSHHDADGGRQDCTLPPTSKLLSEPGVARRASKSPSGAPQIQPTT